jgi:hypothetical protein
MLAALGLVSFALLLAESALRTRAPNAPRPSTLMSSAAARIGSAALAAGRTLARISDLYYLLKHIVGDDIVALATSAWAHVAAPTKLVSGYVAYYREQGAHTKWLVSMALCAATTCAAVYAYPPALYWLLDQASERATPLRAGIAGGVLLVSVAMGAAMMTSGYDDDDDDDDDDVATPPTTKKQSALPLRRRHSTRVARSRGRVLDDDVVDGVDDGDESDVDSESAS